MYWRSNLVASSLLSQLSLSFLTEWRTRVNNDWPNFLFVTILQIWRSFVSCCWPFGRSSKVLRSGKDHFWPSGWFFGDISPLLCVSSGDLLQWSKSQKCPTTKRVKRASSLFDLFEQVLKGERMIENSLLSSFCSIFAVFCCLCTLHLISQELQQLIICATSRRKSYE